VLLLGMDMVKPEPVLQAAYNDAGGGSLKHLIRTS